MNARPEERIDAAERLELMADEKYGVNKDVLAYAMDIDEDTAEDEDIVEQRIFERLAAFIDPKAAPASMDSLGGPPYYTGDWQLNDSVNGCSVCGFPYGRERYGFPELPSGLPRYCPCCGARVVMHSDR